MNTPRADREEPAGQSGPASEGAVPAAGAGAQPTGASGRPRSGARPVPDDQRGRSARDDGKAAAGPRNTVGWTALLVAVLLTIWQAVSSLAIGGIEVDGRDTFTSVSLFVSLILGLAAVVLGIVGLAQRRSPRWPALAGLSVGLYAFVGAVFSWIGGLMNTGSGM